MAVLYRIDLDRSACQGHGLCVIHAPTVFGIDDDDFGDVLQGVVEDGTPDSAAAREAARRCPELAITVVPTDQN